MIGALIKILVVDDDKLIRWSLKEIFLQEGYDVDTAATAKDALRYVEDNSYNLIFTDLEINDENSIEMLEKVKESQPEAEIVVLSALTKNQIELQLGELSIFSIIEKPFRSEQIKSVAKKALDSYNFNKGGSSREENKMEEKD